MRLSSIAFLFGLAWMGAEIVTYAAFIDAFGVAWALAFGLGSTLLGAVALRRLGMVLLSGLRRQLGDGVIFAGPDRASAYAGIGALLLILPGFLSNAIGAVLLAMGARALVTAPAHVEQPRSSPAGTVELDPSDWRRVDEGGDRARDRRTGA